MSVTTQMARISTGVVENKREAFMDIIANDLWAMIYILEGRLGTQSANGTHEPPTRTKL